MANRLAMAESWGWSHLRDIEGSTSDNLKGRTIGVALSGSIAVLEIPRLVRQLMRHGARVQCFLTESAAELVSPTSLEWCSGAPPILKLSGRCEHLEFFGEEGKADLLLLAPATANTLAKVALGLDDNVVTTAATTALGKRIPVMLAPGMHEPMLNNPAVARNLATAKEMGIEVLSPSVEEGKAKMMGVEEMVARICRRLGPGDLEGRRVVLTGGPTREYFDPARCLTNPSSGLSATLLAAEVFRRGGEPRLVYGPGRVQPQPWLACRHVETTEQMGAALAEELGQARTDLMLGVAAVCDFRASEVSPQKLSSRAGKWSLELEATPKLLALARQASPETRIVAFKAASTDQDNELEALAQPYLQNGAAELVVANPISTPGLGFDSARNRYLLCAPGKEGVRLGPASKRELAVALWDWLVHNLLTS